MAPAFPIRASMIVPALLIFFSTGATTAWSQNSTGRVEPVHDPLAGRYAISRGLENVLNIDVQVWGQVNRPGQYSVPDRTDLIGLISFAGGPTEDAKLKEVLVVRPLASGAKVREIDVDAFIHSGNPQLIPELTPGDVVVVPASRSHKFVRWTGVISVAALVANVVILANQNN